MSNRVIKFRTWEVNKMLGRSMSKPFTLTDVHNSGLGTYGDNYTFLQFTGLHDKNGKEIYEGDLIAAVGSTYIYRVAFEDYKFIAIHHNKPYGAWGDLCRFAVLKIEIEVIGNIYESTHLLYG